jgi:phosphomannomutase / phosphoglucomutase
VVTTGSLTTIAMDRLFGTDGIRLVVGREMTPTLVADVVSAFSSWVDGPGPVLVAHDFRTTSDGIARICSGALQMNGVDVCELGVMPSPCFLFNVKHLQARAGLIVTASHNPTEFNGIKFVGPDGLGIRPESEGAIERAFRNRQHRVVPWDQAGKITANPLGVQYYLDSIAANVDRSRIRDAHLTAVVDCGNGTTTVTSPQLLRRLDVRAKTLNATPDGSFPGRPSEPTDQNLADLKKAVPGFGANFGVAYDGDGDRVAYVDEQGKFVPGEVTLALFARDILRRNPGATIATSITSSTAIEDVTRNEGGRLVVTKSGALAVALALEENHAVFAGEENGHYYWPEHHNAADGPMSTAKLLELLARSGRSLSELVRDLPRYAMVKTKVSLPGRLAPNAMEQVKGVLEKEADRIVAFDGVKAFYPSGWLLVRPSGTEPVCRVFAEGRTPADARELADRGVALVRGLIASGPS